MYKLLSSNVDDDNHISLSLEDGSNFIKIASKRDLPKQVDEAVKNMVRRKNHSYILVTSMGDGETWGSNKNGDFFFNESLLGTQNSPVRGITPEKDERLRSDVAPKPRYATFEDAHYFKHHRNKIEHDPSFGYVPHAIWYPKMRTILLIIGVDRTKAPDIAERIDRNELLAVSMGAKLPWDRCSICGQKNKSIFKYCTHLKNDMNRILPNGQKVYAENYFPRFFDISDVTKPAFLAGMQLEKIAGHGDVEFSVDLAEYYDIGRFDKYAETEKQAVIYKQVPAHVEGTIARVSATEKDLPERLLSDLATLKPQEAWGALTHAGIIAKPNEFAYILMKHEGRDDLANQFLGKRAVVAHHKVKGLDERLHSLADINISHQSVKLSRQIPDHVIDDRSIGKLNDRIYQTDKGMRKEAGTNSFVGLGSILSALYMLYRGNAESKFSAYGLIGAGIGEMLSSQDNFSKFVGNNPYATEEMNKKADFHPALKMAAGFTLPYVLSAHIQNKRDRGEAVGPIGNAIANNPGKLGLVGAAGAYHPQAFYKGLKTIGSDLTAGLKNTFKS